MDEYLARPDGVLLPGASLVLGPAWCATKRLTYQLVECTSVVLTHADCVCNEERALRYRHLIDTVGDDVIDLNSSVSKAIWLAAIIRKEGVVERQRAIDYIETYDGGKKKLLQEAQVSLQERAICKKDALVSMFLKDDKYPINDLKEPRCIQYRSKRFHLYLGRFIHPMEKRFCALEVDGCRVCAKGRNSVERASDIVNMWESFLDPVAVLLDHSKFDAHITTKHLLLEHFFYRLLNPDTRLAKVLRWQLDNQGRTKNGTRYSVKGTRMSGDVTTGFGNSVINACMMFAWLQHCGVAGRVYVDGDDSVIVISRSDLYKLDFGWWRTVGMQTKHDLAYQLEHVEFCQTRPVHVAEQGVWRMVRNPKRVVTRTPWTTKKMDPKGYSRLTRTIGWCELASNGGVPVLQAYASWFMKQGSGRLIKSAIREHLRDRIEHVYESQPGMATRLSFEQAWGVSPAEQISIERSSDFEALIRGDFE